MSGVSKIENKKDLKREKIIESASVLFSRKSYHEVMMEDVAKLSSIAKGTVYNYFSSKEELYFSIMRLRMQKLILSLKEKIKDESSSIESLHSFIVHLYMFMMKYQNFFLMYRKESLKAEHELCSELVELEKELKNILADIICSGKSEKLFRKLEEDFAVNIILGCIYGAVHKDIELNSGQDQMIKNREKLFEFVLHGLFSGFEDNKALPLKGKTIVITRTVEQSKESSEIFRQLGANVIIFPTLDIVPPDSWKDFDEVINGKYKIDFIIFTSVHAVKMFVKRLDELHVKIEFSAVGVIEEISNFNLNGKLIFIPRSAIGKEELPESLAQLGALIKTAPVYNVSLPPKEKISSCIEELNNSKPDLFVFTSPSTFENFLQILSVKNPVQYFLNFDVAAIGPTTKTSIENTGVHVNVLPDEYTIDGLAKAIIEYYEK
jgi:uroporphyrinogen-III synthase